MSKLFVDDEDCSDIVPSLSFNCGVCCRNNTFIKFIWSEGNSGQVIFNCYDCKSRFSVTHDKEWIKYKYE